MDQLPAFEDTEAIPTPAPAPQAAPTASVDTSPSAIDNTSAPLPAFEDTEDIPLPSFEDTDAPTNTPAVASQSPVDNTSTALSSTDTSVGPAQGAHEQSQQALAFLEGAGRAIPFANTDSLAQKLRDIATKWGVSPENLHYIAPSQEQIANRAEQHPIAEAAGKIATDVGLFSAANEILPVAESIGGKVLKSFVIGSGLEGADNISKNMMGKGDPEEAVSAKLINMAEAGTLNVLTDGVFNTASSALSKLAEKNAGTWAANFLVGSGYAGEPSLNQVLPSYENGFKKNLYAHPMFKDQVPTNFPGYEDLPDSIKNRLGKNKQAFELGKQFLPEVIRKIADYGVSGAAGLATQHFSGALPGYLAYRAVHSAIGKPLEDMVTPAAKKLAVWAGIHGLNTGHSLNLFAALNHANQVGSGLQAINKSIQNLFEAGGKTVLDKTISDRQRANLKEFVEEGGVNQQIQNQQQEDNQQTTTPSFAEGGDINPPIPSNPEVSNEPDRFAELYPEQAMMIGAARTRRYDYLNSIRPQENSPGLPFDEPMKNPEQERSYNRAIDIAIKPLSVLNHIKEGTLTSEHIQHLNSMYPEVYNQLNKKITEKIAENQLKGEKPSYKTRQGLSMFLGAPLDSTMTPTSIQAAQGVFMQQAAQQQVQMGQGTKPKKNTSKLSKVADQYKTGDQAAASRQQNGS